MTPGILQSMSQPRIPTGRCQIACRPWADRWQWWREATAEATSDLKEATYPVALTVFVVQTVRHFSE